MGFWGYLAILIGLWYLVKFLWPPAKRKNILVVLGSGGHTTEMITYLKKLDFSLVGNVDFICAKDDKVSKEKFKLHFLNRGRLYEIFRSRKVGQSYISSIFTTIYSFLPAIFLVLKLRPDLIITNGPGTALPVCYSGFILKLLRISRTKIVFIESFCRVRTLSLAGRLIYPITNQFYVQWEHLQRDHPKCRYIGLLV